MKYLKTFEGHKYKYHTHELAFFVCMNSFYDEPVVYIAPLSNLYYDNMGYGDIYENEFIDAGIDDTEISEGVFAFLDPTLTKQEYISMLLENGFVQNEEWNSANESDCDDTDDLNDNFSDNDDNDNEYFSEPTYTSSIKNSNKKNKKSNRFDEFNIENFNFKIDYEDLLDSEYLFDDLDFKIKDITEDNIYFFIRGWSDVDFIKITEKNVIKKVLKTIMKLNEDAPKPVSDVEFVVGSSNKDEIIEEGLETPPLVVYYNNNEIPNDLFTTEKPEYEEKFGDFYKKIIITKQTMRFNL